MVSKRLHSIVTTLTIRPQFAIECLRRSNQQGLGHFRTKFGEEVVNRCKANLIRSPSLDGRYVLWVVVFYVRLVSTKTMQVTVSHFNF